MLVKFFRRPDGREFEINVRNIYPEDEIWFTENNIKVSMEDLSDSFVNNGGQFAMYGDTGLDEEEIIVLSNGRTCQDTMKELRIKCEKKLTKD